MKKILLLLLITTFILVFGNFQIVDSEVVKLTHEELQFLDDHPVITLGVDSSFIPYEFIDIDGVYKGMAADYIALVEAKTGINFEVYSYDLDWAETYELGLSKEIDVLPCIGITEGRQEIFLFSDPYITYQRVIYSNDTSSEEYGLDDLTNIRVGVQRNSSHHNYVVSELGVNPVVFNSVEEALTALSENEIDAFVGNLATTAYKLRTLNLMNLEIDEIITMEDNSLAFAVRDDWPLLVSIINKGLAEITEEEKLVISTTWIGIIDEGKDYSQTIRIAIVLATVISVFIGISFYWNYKLKGEIKNRIKIEKALEIAKMDAETATRAKSEFLANMSHEIRTPMNAVIGLTRLLKNTDLDTKQKDYVVKTSRAATNLLGIINDILDFSKIEAGKMIFEKVEFNLDDVIDNIGSVMGIKAFEKNIEFIILKSYSLDRFLIGDPLRLGQIIINLVNNAIKFTTEGEVLLKISEQIKIDNTYELRFSVVDTGIGMTEDQVGNLFKAFNQADSSTTRKYGGTGLGLSISKNLVERMGGKIGVKSKYNIGSEFFFTLEFGIGKDLEINNQISYQKLKNIKTLIIDDNEDAREVTKDCISTFKMKSTLAASGLEAIDIIDKTYDLVLIDWEMPGLNGSETWTEIKLKLKDHLPKVILLTAYGKEDVIKKANEVGINHILMKPINESSLLNTILQIFSEDSKDFISIKPKENTINLDQIKGAKILVVEDNEINQQVVKETLEYEGFIVDIACNGKEAVDMYENDQSYETILMDIQMPIMNGYQATLEIRKRGYKEIPIIALTADVMAGVKEKVFEVGMNAIVAKPIELKKLYNELLNWIEPKERKLNIVSKEDTSIKGVDIINLLQRFNTKEALERVANNEKIYVSILGKYNETFKDFISRMKNMLENKELDNVKSELHTLKGVSGNIGAKRTYELSIILQKEHKEGIDILLSDNFKSISQSIENDFSDITSLIKSIVIDKKSDNILPKRVLLNKFKKLMNQIEEYETESEQTLDDLSSSLDAYNVKDIEKLKIMITSYNFEEASNLCTNIFEFLKGDE